MPFLSSKQYKVCGVILFTFSEFYQIKVQSKMWILEFTDIYMFSMIENIVFNDFIDFNKF